MGFQIPFSLESSARAVWRARPELLFTPETLHGRWLERPVGDTQLARTGPSCIPGGGGEVAVPFSNEILKNHHNNTNTEFFHKVLNLWKQYPLHSIKKKYWNIYTCSDLIISPTSQGQTVLWVPSKVKKRNETYWCVYLKNVIWGLN